jgi:hypothetical protein
MQSSESYLIFHSNLCLLHAVFLFSFTFHSEEDNTMLNPRSFHLSPLLWEPHIQKKQGDLFGNSNFAMTWSFILMQILYIWTEDLKLQRIHKWFFSKDMMDQLISLDITGKKILYCNVRSDCLKQGFSYFVIKRPP